MPRSIRRTALLAAFAVTSICAIGSAGTVTVNTLLNGPLNDGGDVSGLNPGITAFAFFDGDQSGPITSVDSVTLNLQHGYAGDLAVYLRYLPNGISISDPSGFIDAPLFDYINGYDPDDDEFYGVSDVFSGNYSFTNSASQTIQAAALPDDRALITPGSYLPSGYYADGDGPAVIDLSSTFAGQTLAGGSFYLIVVDYFRGDAGVLNSASLNLTLANVPEPTSVAAIGVVGAMLGRRRK